MNFDEYQQWAKTKWGVPDDQPDMMHLCAASMGLAGETGELIDQLKKVVFHGHPVDDALRMKLIKEAGDVLYYYAILLDVIGVNFDEVMQANVKKLNARYPDGFSAERSIQRPEGGGLT